MDYNKDAILEFFIIKIVIVPDLVMKEQTDRIGGKAGL
jgi:hypothetical protein